MEKIKFIYRRIKFIYRRIKFFFNVIKNIIDWIPILYKDRNWDFYYIYVILKFKLEKTKFSLDNGYSDNSYQSSRLNIVIKLLDRIINNYYVDEHDSYAEIEFLPPKYELEIKSERYDEYIEKNLSNLKRLMENKYHCYSKDIDYFETEGLTKKDKQYVAMDISNFKHKKAKKLMFKIMERHIEYWWD
jgi:hypothetical protein